MVGLKTEFIAFTPRLSLPVSPVSVHHLPSLHAILIKFILPLLLTVSPPPLTTKKTNIDSALPLPLLPPSPVPATW